MAAFKIKNEKKIEREAGDDTDVVIIVPEIFPLTGVTELLFSVMQGTREIFSKSLEDVTIDDQKITIPISGEETDNKIGSHRWKLKIIKPDKTSIGKGSFILF